MLQRTITFNRTKSFEHLLEKFLEFTTSGNYKVSGERDPWIFVRKRSLIILKFSGNFQRNEILKNLCQKRGFRIISESNKISGKRALRIFTGKNFFRE